MDFSRPQVEYGMDILISDGIIKEIGKNLKAPKDTKIVNAKDKYVIPGLINCHTHVSMSYFKEITEGLKLQDWLGKVIFPIEAKLTPNDIYYFSLLGMYESLRCGVTTLNDMYFETPSIIKAAKKIGINLITTVTLLDADGNGEKRIENLKNIVKEYPNEKYTLSIHGLYTCSKDYVLKCTALGKELGINLLHMHFCENEMEYSDIQKMHNVEYASDALINYFSDFKMILAHCVVLKDQDIKNMKSLDLGISYNPISNMRLGEYTAINRIKKSGLLFGLGTDGDGSGCNMSILENAKLATLLANDTSTFNSYDALAAATINGAKALGIDDTTGSITVGKNADLVILDLEKTMTFPVHNVISDIVLNGSINNIETVLVKGKTVVENHKIVTIDKKQLYKKCTQLTNQLNKLIESK